MNAHGRGKKLRKPKTQGKIENPFIWKKKKEIKDRIDIWILFETEEEKQEREKKLEKNRN